MVTLCDCRTCELVLVLADVLIYVSLMLTHCNFLILGLLKEILTNMLRDFNNLMYGVENLSC